MKSEQVILNFSDKDLLTETVELFNKRYINSSRNVDLKQLKSDTFEITVSDDGKLLPYGIFDIGTSIGSRLFYKNFRICLTGARKRIDKIVHEGPNYPQHEQELITFDSKELTVNIKKSTGVSSSIGTIIPFLKDEDYKSIIDFCDFKKIEGFKSDNYTTKNGLRIKYSIQDNYLFIFGTDLRYGKDYYRVDLESVFEIEIPEYEI